MQRIGRIVESFGFEPINEGKASNLQTEIAFVHLVKYNTTN